MKLEDCYFEPRITFIEFEEYSSKGEIITTCWYKNKVGWKWNGVALISKYREFCYNMTCVFL